MLHIIDVLIIYFINIINSMNHVYDINRLVQVDSALCYQVISLFTCMHFVIYISDVCILKKKAFVPTASDSQLGSFGKNTHRRCTPRQAGKFQI